MRNTLFGYRKSENKDKIDFYKTPVYVTKALFEREKFIGMIWEPCSGNGNISKVIEHYNKCFSSDLRKDSKVYGQGGVDFLTQTKKVKNIVTNPPFTFALNVLLKSKELAERKIALFLRLQFLESQKRYKMFQDKDFPLKKLYVFSKRVSFENKCMVPYAWFIWEKGYDKKPYLDWIL